MVNNQDPRNIKDILDTLSEQSKSFQGIWKRAKNYAWDILGILLMAFSVMVLIATLLPRLVAGSSLLNWTNFIRFGLGWGSIFVVASGIVLGIWMLKKQAGEPNSVIWVRIFALEIAIFALIALFTVLGGHSLPGAGEGWAGGGGGGGGEGGVR
ncbi:MAG: hypothetical protein J7L35_07320, partial [Anaerolineales bacterium]|nr:hypothetical protein [Anaerolineales bacterium]